MIARGAEDRSQESEDRKCIRISEDQGAGDQEIRGCSILDTGCSIPSIILPYDLRPRGAGRTGLVERNMAGHL